MLDLYVINDKKIIILRDINMIQHYNEIDSNLFQNIVETNIDWSTVIHVGYVLFEH